MGSGLNFVCTQLITLDLINCEFFNSNHVIVSDTFGSFHHEYLVNAKLGLLCATWTLFE